MTTNKIQIGSKYKFASSGIEATVVDIEKFDYHGFITYTVCYTVDLGPGTEHIRRRELSHFMSIVK